jgi:pimeloyl-ACP methyl ester carboxylesterase
MPYAVNGKVHIYYEVEGEGPPVMLLHGAMTDSELWKECSYVDALKKDYQLILQDERAHGKSNRQYPPEEHTEKNTARDIITVLDELGIESGHLFGFSGGGLHALSVAVLYPQRVKSLIIFGMSPKFSGSQANTQIAQLTLAGPEATIKFMESSRGGEPLREAAKARIYASDFKALGYAMSHPQYLHLVEVLPDIKMPVLVMVGEEDNLFNHETLREEYSPVPDLTFVTIPGIGHSIERSDLVVPHIKDFLAKVSK